MLYPNTFETKIGFNQVRELIKSACICPLGAAYVDEIRFTHHYDTLNKQLEQTEEFRQILLMERHFPAQDYYDMTPELNRVILPGTYIEADQLTLLLRSLQSISDVIRFIATLESEEYPRLKELAQPIWLNDHILPRLNALIDEKGEIRDNASQKLHEIRRSIRSKNTKIDRTLARVLAAAKKTGMIPDDLEPTVRDGRPVVPVPATHKRKIHGLIHGESATGQTVYIEPEEVLQLNNEIKELESEERREIIRILSEFTELIRPDIPALKAAYHFLGCVDFIRAKAKIAIQLQAQLPLLRKKASLNWKEAVHPLLFLTHQPQGKIVVPLDIQLHEQKRILVISGPNAGGKSICLKTIGLLQYMLQCGLLVPANPNSEFGIFEKIFLDIGDEQSLENDLSTYSSHLLNMKHFMGNATAHTLFLIDEFGTGTEPQLGGAIAEAVLENLDQKKAFGVVTTHYANLKLLANDKNGLINGAMQFDTRHMRPLFKLKPGKPGSSFAIEIARKIGFPQEILDSARDKSGTTQLDFDRQLQELESEKRDLDGKRTQLKVADDFLAEMVEKYQSLNKELENKRKEIIEEAHKEAREVIAKSNRIIEKTIREIREAQADKEKTKALRENVKTHAESLQEKPNKKTAKKRKEKPQAANSIKVPTKPLQNGDYVKASGHSNIGQIESIKGKKAKVAFGAMHFEIPLNQLEKTSGKPKVKIPKASVSSYANDMNEKMAQFQMNLDIRGKRVEEAIAELQHFIDDAILLRIPEVTILHGKGTGALRELVRNFLSTIPEVNSYKDEHIERGGHGITVVSFRL